MLGWKNKLIFIGVVVNAKNNMLDTQYIMSNDGDWLGWYVCVCIGMYVCVYVCVCMYVCMYVCVCMYVSMFACMYVCVCMYVCMYVCVYVCMYACM